MTVKQFLLIIRDDDKGTFSVEGPMINDEPWNDAVVRAQEEGRRIRCSSVDGETNLEQLKRSYASQYSLLNVPPGSIVRPRSELD
jgi:hypothetical protein